MADPVTVWLTRVEVAAVLRVSPKTVDRMIDDGRLRAYRLPPRGVRIRQADVDALLERIPPIQRR